MVESLSKGSENYDRHAKSIKALYTDATFRKDVFAFAKKEYWDEFLEFLLTMNDPKGKEYQKTYDRFIHRDAPREINISRGTQKNIASYMDADGEDPSGALWPKAVLEIESMIVRDSLGRYISAGIKKVDEKYGAKARDQAIAAKEIEIKKKYLPGMM